MFNIILLNSKDAYSVEIVPSREYASQPSIIEMRNSPIVNKYSRTPSNDQYPTKSAIKKLVFYFCYVKKINK